MHDDIANTRSILALLIAVALATAATVARAQLVAGCPQYVYMGNNPNSTDAPDWSEQAQGVANDGKHWFFTHNVLSDADFGGPPESAIIKYEKNWRAVSGDDPGKLAGRTTPSILYGQGIWHFGDPDHYGGYIFVPFEGSGPLRAVIAVLRASNLTMVDWVDIGPYQPKTGWVAIDPVDRLLYTSDDNLVAGTPLLAYPLDVSKVEDGVLGNFLEFPPIEVEVQDDDGGPVAGEFSYMQGGVFTPWGDLFLIAGKAGASAASVRGGIHLFRRTTDGSPLDGGAFRLMQSSRNVNASVGDPIFAYRYDPSGVFHSGEEPEGIDWWNQDNDPHSRYDGQLHAILLDNQLGDDQIWLKHYQVAYSCMQGIDSDGDGVADWEEVYTFNTHPLLTDSDGDGWEDTVDNCPSVENGGQEDIDGDGAGDVCDADADGDGQSNDAEQACGSNALDPSDTAPDLDADTLPDCVDPDDDGDGQADEDELTCGSDPRDAGSTSPDFDTDGLLDCIDPDDDDDTVPDEADRCAGTVIPDPLIPASGELKTNRYSLLDGDLIFDRRNAANRDNDEFTIAGTGGCNATQIADALGLGRDHYVHGLSRGVLKTWIDAVR